MSFPGSKLLGARYITLLLRHVLLRLLNHRDSKGGESLLHFVANVASARRFQPLSDEEDGMLLPDSCAMSCRYRLW